MAFLVDGSSDNNIEEMVIKSPHYDTKKYYKILVKAEALRLNSMFQESVKHYLAALMIERNNIQIYIGLAQAYVHLDKLDKAIEILEKAKSIDPSDANIPYEIGCCFMRMGLPCVAIVNLKEAILLDKENINAQLQLAVAHELMEEYDMALMVYQRIIDVHPSFLNAYQHKAALLVELNKYQEAASIFAELIKINPQYYKAYLGIGICFDKMDKITSAVRYYKKFLSMKPNSKNAPDVRARLEKIYDERDCEANFLKLT